MAKGTRPTIAARHHFPFKHLPMYKTGALSLFQESFCQAFLEKRKSRPPDKSKFENQLLDVTWSKQKEASGEKTPLASVFITCYF